MDVFDAAYNTSLTGGVMGTTAVDTDLDSTPNYLDLDSDGDTIPDATEARDTASYVAYPVTIDDAADIDDDGILDIYDTGSAFGGGSAAFKSGSNFANSDNDDTTDSVPDYLDLDLSLIHI